MHNENMNDIKISEVSNNNLTKIIKNELDSIRNELKISFIGKLSTPKNLLIKHLTNIDFSSDNIGKINRYCTVISKWKEISSAESCISDFEKYAFKEKLEKREGFGFIFTSESGKSLKIEDIGNYLNDFHKNIDKFEVYLPESEESILKHCIIYNTPPIGYSDELDKFVVEQCYKSCYLYVFVINTDESILEKEMKIISLLMGKRNVIELKFVMAYSGKMSSGDYITNELHYVSKIKEICATFPGIIIVSGHGYISNGKESCYNSTNEEDGVPEENKITDLGEFIRQTPTEEIIWAAVKNYKLKNKSSIKSAFVENNDNIKCELRNSVENIEKTVNFISKSVKSDQLKDEIFQFTKAIKSISLDKIYHTNYLIFGNRLINNSDFTQALIGQNISHDKYLLGNISVIKFNFIQTNREYFVLHNDNKLINNEHDICELNNLSELVSNLQMSSSNENISIEFYLDYEIHPIINDEMKIIYYNDFDIDNEELLNKYNDYDGIALILDYKSDNNNNNNKNRDIIKYFQLKHRHVQIYILINHDEGISINNDKCVVEDELEIEIGDLMNVSDFNLKFYKILSNIKYCKTANEIISLIQKFNSDFDESINFDWNNKDISDWEFQQLFNAMNSKIKPFLSHLNITKIKTIASEEINKFINKIIMKKMNVSDEILFPGIQFEVKDSEILNQRGVLNRTKMIEKIREYMSDEKARKILIDSANYKKILGDIIDPLNKKYFKPTIFM